MTTYCYECSRQTKSRTDDESEYCAVCGQKKYQYD